MTLIDQLVDFYYKYEGWSDDQLDEKDILEYFERIIELGNIVYFTDYSGDLCGYVDYWRLDFDQLGRFLCRAGFSSREEDIVNGPVAFCVSVVIKPEFRKGEVIKYLKTEFVKRNFNAEYFVGERQKGKHKPLIVLDRKRVSKLLEVSNGK